MFAYYSVGSANSIGKRLYASIRCNYLLKDQYNDTQIANKELKNRQIYEMRTYIGANKITQESVSDEIKNLQQKNRHLSIQTQNYHNFFTRSQIIEEAKGLQEQQYNIRTKNNKAHGNQKSHNFSNSRNFKQRQSRLKNFMNKIHNKESQNGQEEHFLHRILNQEIKIVESQFNVQGEQQQFQSILDLNQKEMVQLKSKLTQKEARTHNKVSVVRYQSKQKIPKKISPKKMKTQAYQEQNKEISKLVNFQLEQTQNLIHFYSQQLKKSEQTNQMLQQKIIEEEKKNILLNLTCIERQA